MADCGTHRYECPCSGSYPAILQKSCFHVTTVSTSAQGPANSMAFEGKVIAITGSASGIGLATAQILSKKGAIVCLCDVDQDAIKKAEGHFTSRQARYTMATVDVSNKEQVENWIQGIVDRFGKLDGAVNNAGIIGKHHGLRAVADLDDDEWHKIIAVNLTGTMYCLRAELRKIADGGSIVNLSSIHGLQGASWLAVLGGIHSTGTWQFTDTSD